MVSMTHGTLFRLSVTTHGYSYHLTSFKPSAAVGWQFQSYYGWNLAGNGASFLFQKVNQHCLGVVTRASGSTITDPSNFLDWYMPYNIHSRKKGRAANSTSHESRDNWHISAKAHSPFNQMMRPSGQVYYIWDDVQDTSRNLESYVFYIAPTNTSLLDLDLLQWISPVEVNYPSLVKKMVHIPGTYDTKDLVMLLMCLGEPMSVIAWFFRCEHDWLRCSRSRSLSLPSSFSVLLPLVSS